MEKINNSNKKIDYLNEEDDKQFHGIYPNIKIPWKRSKKDYWQDIENIIDTADKKRRYVKLISFAVAASVLLFISYITIAKISTISVKTAFGLHQTTLLPDGSEVVLNAGSEINYHRFNWLNNRKIEMSGEAFFKVVKGRKFKIVAPNGTIIVLGTSFNVYNRGNNLVVTCVTGKVRVLAKDQNDVVLNPNQKFNLNNDQVEIVKNIDPIKELSWINNSFAFNGVPLRTVFQEIERQFNVKIIYRGDLNKSYSGIFPKSSIENVLEIVCRPFGYQYQIIGENEFVIINKNIF